MRDDIWFFSPVLSVLQSKYRHSQQGKLEPHFHFHSHPVSICWSHRHRHSYVCVVCVRCCSMKCLPSFLILFTLSHCCRIRWFSISSHSLNSTCSTNVPSTNTTSTTTATTFSTKQKWEQLWGCSGTGYVWYCLHVQTKWDCHITFI